MEVQAILRKYRQSPRKVRLIADLVRGQDTIIALDQLKFSVQKAARPVAKLIQSAIANAEHNFSLDKNNLFIKKITVDDGPTLKRWRARAFGRAATIRKRTSHITVILDEKNPAKQVAQKDKTSSEQKNTKTDIKNVNKLKDIKKELKIDDDKSEKSSDDQTEKAEQIGKRQHQSNIKKKGFIPKVFQRKSG